MITDFECFKEIILNNYTYTIEQKFKQPEEYNEDCQDSFKYVYEFHHEDYIKLVYNETFNSISLELHNYELDFNFYLNRTNFETFYNSIDKYSNNKPKVDVILKLYNEFKRIKGESI